MLFAQLVADMAHADEGHAQALGRSARELLRGGRTDLLAPHLHRLRSLELGDQPYAQILVAELTRQTAPSALDEALDLIERARATFEAGGDQAGVAFSWWAHGNQLLSVGDLEGASAAWRLAVQLDPTVDPVEGLALANLAFTSYCLDGRVPAALAMAGEAAEAARERGHGRAEGLALVHCGYLEAVAGQLSAAEASFRAADQVFAAQPTMSIEWPMAQAGLGSLAAIRGAPAEADDAYLCGLLLARELHSSRDEAIVRLQRAGHTADLDARQAHVDCRYALHTFEALGDRWWANEARMVRAQAALASGEPEAARMVADALSPRLTNPVARARCLITAGRAHLAARDIETAVERAGAARRAVGGTGASYIEVLALLLEAECDPGRAPEAITRARTLSEGEPALDHTWRSRPRLEVRVLGNQTMRVGGRDPGAPHQPGRAPGAGAVRVGPRGSARRPDHGLALARP